MIEKCLSAFDPIGLKEANEQASLLRRVDTKYVIPPVRLPELLAQWQNTHWVLSVEGKRVSHYQSTYYDTPQLDLYRAHHAGAANRVKLRVRTYTESNLSYYEVKVRSNQGVTDKKRIRLKEDAQLSSLLIASQQQYPRHLQTAEVHPTLQVDYDRITLVSKKGGERITIDLELTYRKDERIVSYNDRVIIEVKQDRGVRSQVIPHFRRLCIYPGSVSKYCLGVLSLYSNVKQNLFKLPLRILAKQLRHNGTPAIDR